MYAFNRVNPMGLAFRMMELSDGKTSIKMQHKELIVNHSIAMMSQGWYDWMMRDMYIQDAFPFLTAQEREFLLTGLTPTEWTQIFSTANGENE
jgi:hypothetical protein